MTDPFTQLAVIITASLLSCWVARLAKVPSILLMLISGMAIGPITGWVDPNTLFGQLLLPAVSISVAIILFEGGLSFRLEKMKEIGPTVVKLVGYSTLFGILLGSAFLIYVIGFPQRISILLAAILVITGPTVIIPLLQQLHIKEPARSILRWEGILIDPIGAIAAVLIFEALFQSNSNLPILAILQGIVTSIIAGVTTAFIAAQIFLYGIRRYLIPDVLHNPVVLLLLVAAYSISNWFQADSGLVSATMMGLLLANQKKFPIHHIVEFKESLRIILIAFVFVTLTASIDLKLLLDWWEEVLALTAFLLLIVRPLTVWLSTLKSDLNWKEKLLMMLIAPRGIVSASVASLFALELSHLGYDDGSQLVPIVFSVIAVTVVFTSIAAFIAAPALKLSMSFEPGVLIIGANPFARALGKALVDAKLVPHYIDTNFWNISKTKHQKGEMYHGSFITYPEDNFDTLDEIGTVLAITENDDINCLAVNHLARFFNQKQLYQFHPQRETIPEHLVGRPLFDKSIPHSTLRKCLDEGAMIRSTKLGEKFPYQAWREKYPNGLPLLFVPPGSPVQNISDPSVFQGNEKGTLIFLNEILK